MALSFRYANLDEYPAIAAFLDEFWAKNHVYVRDKELFDWTFKSDLWHESGYCFALAEDGGQLAGILGGIPFEFNTFGKKDSGVWIANYVIRPDHRKGTAALQLLSQFRKPSMHAVIASGINPATSAIYRVLRGEVLPFMPRYVTVFPGQTERMAHLLNVAYPDWSAEQVSNLAAAFTATHTATPAEAAAHLPGNWDAAGWSPHAESTVGVARDMRFLKWRYLDHPRFTYRFVVIEENGRPGMLVWRLETIRQATPEGLKDVERIGRIVELLPASAANAQALLGAATAAMRAEGAFGADFYGFNSAINCHLDQAGFRNSKQHELGEKIPSRFQPLDGKGGGILSAMFLTGGGPAFDEATCPWYWTKADSDQDRPN